MCQRSDLSFQEDKVCTRGRPSRQQANRPNVYHRGDHQGQQARRAERMQRDRVLGARDSVGGLVRIDRMDGDCKGMRTLHSMSFDMGRKRLFNLVNPSKTKGDALFHVLAALLLPSRKDTQMLSTSMQISFHAVQRDMNCVPKHFSLCRSLAMRRGLHFFTAMFRAAIRRGCRQVHIVCRRVTPFGRHQTNTLSKKVGRGLTLYYTLIRTPGILFLSRPAANMSPISHQRF